MILARRSRLLPSRSAAARVSSVDWPLTCNTRARIRTRSDRSCKLITACSGIEAKKVSRSGTGCHIRFHHLFWIDDAIKFSLSDKSQLQGGSLECEVIIHRVMRDLRCFVVTDHRRERGYQHQGAVHILFDLLQIRFGALDQELAEVGVAIGHDCDRVGDVEDHQRLVNVHFEIAARAAETTATSLAMTCTAIMVRASHWVGLTL